MRGASARLGPGLVDLLQEETAGPTLVCFACAGGHAQSFVPWTAALRGRARLIAAELPGRGRRYAEPFAASVETAAREIADALTEADLAGLVLVGHSLGAYLAHATALALRGSGRERVAGLVLCARAAPGTAAPDDPPHGSTDALRAYLSGLDGTPAPVLADDAFLNALRPVLAADFALVRRYRPADTPALALPLHLVGATADPVASLPALLGWRRYVTGPLSLALMDGGHFAPLSDPLAILAAAGRFRTPSAGRR